MTVVRLTNGILQGLAADTKPTTYPDGTIFYESDTGNRYVYLSGAWIAQTSKYTYDYTVFFDSTVSLYKAVNGKTGAITTSNASLDPVITTLLALGSVSIFVQSGTHTLSGGFAGWTITASYTNLVFDTHATVIIPSGYASFVFKFTQPGASSGCNYSTVEGGFFTGGGAVARNWTFLLIEGSVAGGNVCRSGARYCVVWGAGIGIHITTTNATAYANGNVSDTCRFYDCVNFIKFTRTLGTTDYNTFRNFDMQTTTNTTAGIVDVDGEGNEFPNCVLWDINTGASGSSTPSTNIKSTATYTGVTKTMSTQAFTNLGVGTFVYQDMPSKSVSNIFTQTQFFSKDTQDLLVLYRPINTVGSGGRAALRFDHKNSSGSQTIYAYIIDEIVANTAGAESAKLEVWVKNAGAASNTINFANDGGIDHKVVTIPADPASGYIKTYPKAVDSNNDAWFMKQKINGTVTEVRMS